MSLHLCVDCRAEDPDNARKPRDVVDPTAKSPRCATHDRQHQRQLKKNRRSATVERTRGITATESHELLLFQGGTCWFCRRATGTTKALAHDHDHKHCPGKDSCRVCLRGRLCGPCNQILGHLRDDPEAFDRAAAYLRGDTPWARLQASKQVFAVGDVVRTNRHWAAEGGYSYVGAVVEIDPKPIDDTRLRVRVVGDNPGEPGWWYDPMHLEPVDPPHPLAETFLVAGAKFPASTGIAAGAVSGMDTAMRQASEFDQAVAQLAKLLDVPRERAIDLLTQDMNGSGRGIQESLERVSARELDNRRLTFGDGSR